MAKRLLLFAGLVIVLCLSACQPGIVTPSVPTAPARVVEYVSPDQELFMRLDTGAFLYVPPNALKESYIRFERLDSMPGDTPSVPESAKVLSPFYDLDISADHLDSPVTLVLPYDPVPLEELGLSGQAIEDNMFLAIPNGDGWKRVYGVVDQKEHTFTTLLSSLSDPLMMWDFHTLDNPILTDYKVKISGEWYSLSSLVAFAPPVKFYIYGGELQIGQPITLSISRRWKHDFFLPCLASLEESDAVIVNPVLVLDHGRRIPLFADQVIVGQRLDGEVETREIRLDFQTTPISTSPEEIRGLGFQINYWSVDLPVDKDCEKAESFWNTIYKELLVTYAGGDGTPPPQSTEQAIVPPEAPTLTPLVPVTRTQPVPSAIVTRAPSPTKSIRATPSVPSGGIGMANPASVYCIQQGYTIDTRTDAGGNEFGMCIFPDGSECDEWAYYEGRCAPGQASSLAQRYVGAYVIGQYTRTSRPVNGNITQATVRRIERVIEAVDDATILVQVTYDGDGAGLIDVPGTWTYTVNLQTGQTTKASGQDNPQSWGTLVNSGESALLYNFDYEETFEGWRYHWTGSIQRDPQTYLLLSMQKTGNTYDSNGSLWGKFEDVVTLIESHIP